MGETEDQYFFEISQSHKDKRHMFSFLYRIWLRT